MKKKKKGFITDTDLFNTFVRILENGRALSLAHGNELQWSYNIPVKQYQDQDIYMQMAYAMMCSTTRARGGKDAHRLPDVSINIIPRVGIPLTIPARSVDVDHPILKKLKDRFDENLARKNKVIKLSKSKYDDGVDLPDGTKPKGVDPVKDTLDNIDDGVDLDKEGRET